MFRRILAASIILCASSSAFAVNVTVTSQNGDVSIIGDDLPDSVVIESFFDGVLIIRGRNTGPFDLWDLYIDLGDGGNERRSTTFLYRSSHSDITVRLGRDADYFDAANIITSGNFKVNMGSGRDTAQAFDIVAREFRYLQGYGTGVFNIANHHSQH